MLLRPFLYDVTSCASYLFGCGTHRKLAVVDAHADLVDDYLAAVAALGSPITAAFETHVLALTDAEAFADALEAGMPPPRADQAQIVGANRAGKLATPA